MISTSKPGIKIVCIKETTNFMKVISSRVHGILDYLVGIILIASPWLFGFADGSAKMSIPIILGVGALAYSIITKYELGIFRLIPFKIHLIFDALSGVLLAASPWLFGFADEVYVPHLVFGLLEMVVVMLTQSVTSLEVQGVKY